MAIERKCSVCNVGEGVATIVSANGRDYCTTHAPKIRDVAVKDLSADQKQTALVETSMTMGRYAERQVKALESIRGLLIFIVIVVIFGMVVQVLASCVGG